MLRAIVQAEGVYYSLGLLDNSEATKHKSSLTASLEMPSRMQEVLPRRAQWQALSVSTPLPVFGLDQPGDAYIIY